MLRGLVVAFAFVVAPLLASWPADVAASGPDDLYGHVAVLVFTTSGTATLEGATRRVHPEVIAVDAGAVRSTMMADGESVLTHVRAEEIRAKERADRLLVLELHPTGSGERLLIVRAYDATGATPRRSVAVTDETMGERLERTLRDLPPAVPPKKTLSSWLATTKDVLFFDVNAFGGRKMLDEEDWEALAVHNEIGATGTFGPPNWPVHVALEAYGSRAAHAKTSTTTVEIGAGVRRIFDFGAIRPYVGLGVEGARADYIVEVDEEVFETEADRGIGAWIGGCASFRFGNYGNVGVLVRYSTAEVELGARTVDAGGLHVGVTIGGGSARPPAAR